jgi:Tfp pilus assembly protein PilX
MKNHAAQESGAALIVAMLLMLVLGIVLLGFYFVTAGEQKVAASNRDNELTYYWAVAGLEQMSNAIADYFAYNASPTPAGITAWATNSSNFASYPQVPPSYLPNLVTATYTLYCWQPQTAGPCASAPNLVLCSTVTGNSLGNCNGTIGGNGPLAGLEGVITPFLLTVVADGPNNTEVKLNRVVQEVAVPIFEFGVFSDSDLSFFAGPTFYFGGRTHTNGNLFLAQDSGNALLLNDHVTAAKSIVRDQLENGYAMAAYSDTSCQYSGKYCAYVNVLTTTNGCPSTATGLQTGNCVTLQLNQGSVENGPGSTTNPNWVSLSKTTYNYFIQDSQTGGKALNIAIALPGISAQPIAMIQRPPASESSTSALGMARFYNQASLRILLSDTAADITSLPGIDTTVQPYPLAEVGSTSGYPTGSGNYTIQRTNSSNLYYLPLGDGCHPPLAESVGSTDNDYMFGAGTTLLGGYIKIEMQCAPTAGCASTWKDVTQEILAQGISRDVGPGTAMAAATLTLASNGSLTAGTTYYYTVTATNQYGETVGTQTSGLKTSSGSQTIKLTWPAVTGATGYNVYRTTTSGNYTGTGNGVINLVVGTAQGTSWVSPYSPTATFTDSGAISLASTSGPPPSTCTNNSIIHLEEAAPGVSLTGSTWSALTPTNFVPINMYDPREGEVRDTAGVSTSSLNGIMNVVEVDVGNLQQWFAGNIATSGKYAFNGPDALNNGGYILYTSDRRMNCNDSTTSLEGNCSPTWGGTGETGEFGNEDIINPGSTTGTPNGQLDTPEEDVDGDGVFRTYGAYPHPIATSTSTFNQTQTVPNGTWPYIIGQVSSLDPAFVRITTTQALKNSVIIFRRALRLVDGTLGNLPPLAAAHPSSGSACSGGTAGGFTAASENPIYVQGDYNASTTNAFNDAFPLCHVPAAVMGDAVTLLSNNWTPGAQSGYTSGDYSSFASPTWATTGTGCTLSPKQRCATTTYYRMAIMGGKPIPFTTFSGTTAQYTWFGTRDDVGTDGGAQNFIRYIEDWKTSGVSLNYLGSLSSFYTSRQGTGIFKCCNTVYNSPTRNFTFDANFQSISELPPGTPRFTDVNALSYYQSTLPSQ